MGTESGRVIKKLCTGSATTGSINTNSNGVYVKWVKQKDSTSTSFTGKWTTSTVTCCNKILLENQMFSSYNGFYTFDTAAGYYKQESGDTILFSGANKYASSTSIMVSKTIRVFDPNSSSQDTIVISIT